MGDRAEKRKFKTLVCILIYAQALDFIVPVPDYPFWWLYLFGAFVDSSVFYLVYSLISREYSNILFSILLLQIFSGITQVGGFFAEWMYILYNYEIYARVNDMYSPILKAILALKTIFLGLGGYGLYRRAFKRNHRRAYDPGVVLSNDYRTNQDKTETQE